jgi:hypothetical protein
VAIAYYGTTLTSLEWYWPTGIGLVAAWPIYLLFDGPLRFVLTGMKMLLGLAILAGIVLVIAHLMQQGG